MKKDYQLSEMRAVDDFAAYGARLVPFSGAKGDDKLDVELSEGKLSGFRISNKHTTKGSISFKLDDLLKDSRQGIAMGAKVIRRIEFECPVTGKLHKYILSEQDDYLEAITDEEAKEED